MGDSYYGIENLNSSNYDLAYDDNSTSQETTSFSSYDLVDNIESGKNKKKETPNYYDGAYDFEQIESISQGLSEKERIMGKKVKFKISSLIKPGGFLKNSPKHNNEQFHNWNEEYQEIHDMKFSTGDLSTAYKKMSSLGNRFKQSAVQYASIIISEKSLDVNEKVIKPVNLGGNLRKKN